MEITIRHYTSQPLFSTDYEKVRTFLRELNQEKLVYPGFTWGRWEWMTTHPALDRESLGKIGIWETDGRIVGLVTYESSLGDAYLFAAQEYSTLLPEMLNYTKNALASKDGVKVIIDNNDRAMQRAAVKEGFIATADQECTAMLDITDSLSYQLPDGFRIVSMADGWDFAKYQEIMWRGFNHEGPPPSNEIETRIHKEMLSSPTIIPELVLAVVAPDGRYVSHCGMWYTPGDDYALVEPVATDPDYRRMGLGKAAVLEAVRRCGKLGAKIALVGSSQQFYFSIGFFPIHTGNWWIIG